MRIPYLAVLRNKKGTISSRFEVLVREDYMQFSKTDLETAECFSIDPIRPCKDKDGVEVYKIILFRELELNKIEQMDEYWCELCIIEKIGWIKFHVIRVTQ